MAHIQFIPQSFNCTIQSGKVLNVCAAVCVNHIPEQVYLRSLIDPETDREGPFLSHTKSLHFKVSW